MHGGPDIVGFGSVSVDDYLYVDQCLDADKGRIISRNVDYGGNCATALVTASSLGATVGYIGWLSSEPKDEHLIEHLISSKVDVSRACLSSQAQPIQATILVGGDGGRFIAYRDDGAATSPLMLTKEALFGARILHVDSYAGNSLDAVRLARQLGLIIVGDVEWSMNEQSDQLRNLCHHLIVPIGYAKTMTNSTEPRAMLDALWSETHVCVVITCGDEGSYLRIGGDKPEYWHQPAFKVKAVDTTGCGDCFHGAYGVALNMNHDLLYCVKYSAASAAIAAMHRGGQAAVVHATSDKVLAMLNTPDAPVAVHL